MRVETIAKASVSIAKAKNVERSVFKSCKCSSSIVRRHTSFILVRFVIVAEFPLLLNRTNFDSLMVDNLCF